MQIRAGLKGCEHMFRTKILANYWSLRPFWLKMVIIFLVGIIAGLGQAPFNFPVLTLISFALILRLVHEPKQKFNEKKANRVFRISVSDYTESTLLPHLLRRLSSEAPRITLDVLTPSDVSYQNVEQGTVDLVINRFDVLPQSFHQMTIWRDTFSCLFSQSNPIAMINVT